MTNGIQGGVEVGLVPDGLKGEILNAGDKWSDSAFFAPGLETNSEHMTALPVGGRVAGILRQLRRTKHEVETKRKNYACMEDLKGNLFRIQTPGQLKYALEEAGIGATVIITYKGKEFVKAYEKELHQFEVEVVKRGEKVLAS